MEDIPILDGEEMWAQEAIDSRISGKYKVSYYLTAQSVGFKWFDSFNKATMFCLKLKTGDVIEIKWYPNER